MENDKPIFVACDSDDRQCPVIAATSDDCAKLAVEQFDLQYSLRNISNWDRTSSTANTAREKRVWRETIETGRRYVSIYELTNRQEKIGSSVLD